MRNKFVLRPIIACLPGIFLALSAASHAALATLNIDITGNNNGIAYGNNSDADANALTTEPPTLPPSGNTLNIVTGGKAKAAYGALGGNDVSNNTVHMTGGELTYGAALGGVSVFGAATNNHVVISGGSLSRGSEIRGGGRWWWHRLR